MLLAHKIHKGYNYAWRVGIKGSGDSYGSMFHKSIAETFFNAASNPKDSLHPKIIEAISGGVTALEDMIREEIFMPFVGRCSEKLQVGQIISMASGVSTWVKAMYDFLKDIPSIARDAETIFIKPEGCLHGCYKFKDGEFKGDVLEIKGRYDALMFNPAKTDARLFEFKGFRKSDVTVPLSQSLIYAWLLYKSTGIISSIEIIYLDETSQPPVIFDARTVRAMIVSALPDLFTSVYNVISLRKEPEILQDKELCSECKFRRTCKDNIRDLFRGKRRGSSMLSVLIFFLATILIMTQAFFFASNSHESLLEEREIAGARMKLEGYVQEALIRIRDNTITSYNAPGFEYSPKGDGFHLIKVYTRLNIGPLLTHEVITSQDKIVSYEERWSNGQ